MVPVGGVSPEFDSRKDEQVGVELGLCINGDFECPDCCTVCGDPADVSGWTLSCD